MIRLVDLHKRFGAQEVLRGVSLDFRTGETTVILGESGAGKSVILKHIVGLLRPDRGEVWFHDVPIHRLGEHELVAVRRRFGFLFQMGGLFDSMSALENVAFPLEEHTAWPPEKIRAVARQKLRMVGLDESVDGKKPAQLSGGQRKRVALARAIALDPEVILYDEPTTGLDPIRADVINELILKLDRELHVTSVVVTHDMASAFKVADRLVMLWEGRIIADGSVEEIRRCPDPRVQRFIRGEASEEDLALLRSGSSRP